MGRRQPAPSKGSPGANRSWLVLAVVVVAAAAWWMLRPDSDARLGEDLTGRAAASPMSPMSSRAGSAARPVAPAVPARGNLPPLPLGYPAARPIDVVAAAYEFAARRPDILGHVPCFCGCEHEGHASNVDCFVASRDADGRVTWDAHGIG